MSHERPNTLRLSAKAITTMIGTDPEFLVELQRCVVREVVRQMMPKDLNTLVSNMIQSEVAAARSAIIAAGVDGQAVQEFAERRVREVISATRARSRDVRLTDAEQDQLRKAINAAALNLVNDTIDARIVGIEAEVKRRTDDALAQADSVVEELVRERFDRGLDALVNSKVDERLSALKAAL